MIEIMILAVCFQLKQLKKKNSQLTTPLFYFIVVGPVGAIEQYIEIALKTCPQRNDNRLGV